MKLLCLFLSILLVAFTHQPHRVISQDASDGGLLAPHEPYSDKGPIRQRLGEQFKSTILFMWESEIHSTKKTETSQESVKSIEREVLQKLLRLSRSELQSLDEAFAVRKRESEENARAISILMSQEQLLNYSLQQDETPRLDISELTSVSPGYLKKLFHQTAQAEDKSEEKLVARLDELLDPIQKEILFVRWIKLDTLHTRFSQSYLDLSDEQAAEIRIAAQDFRKVQWKIEQDYKKARRDAAETTSKKSAGDIGLRIVRSRDWHRARFTIISHLTPGQFRKCQHLLRSDPKYLKLSFEELLTRAEERAQSESDTSFIGETELEVLSPLYTEGIRLEKATK